MVPIYKHIYFFYFLRYTIFVLTAHAAIVIIDIIFDKPIFVSRILHCYVVARDETNNNNNNTLFSVPVIFIVIIVVTVTRQRDRLEGLRLSDRR